MRKNSLFLIQALIALSLVFAIGCSKDAPSDNSEKPPVIDPNTPVKDPEGTITANISTSTFIDIPDIGTIRWRGPDNFEVWHYYGNGLVSICNLGEMKGLGNITNIPQTGYTIPKQLNTEVACETGYGYVIKFEGGNSPTALYVRLYVTEAIVSTSGGVMGEKVKYQQPFEPTTLTVSKDLLSFAKEQGTQNITITTDASNWSYSCDASWISIVKNNNNTLSVSVERNENIAERISSITIQANEKQKTIDVKQEAGTIPSTSAPYSIGDIYNEKGVLGIVYKVETGGTHGMVVSLKETMCAWSTTYEVTGCSDMSNGINNMNTIKKIAGWENKYPAFKWCDDLNTGGVSGWYLPARDELNNLYANSTTVNTTLTYCGGMQITVAINAYYWSSSEYNYNCAWFQDFSKGSQFYDGYQRYADDNFHYGYYNSTKIDAFIVRAVSAF